MDGSTAWIELAAIPPARRRKYELKSGVWLGTRAGVVRVSRGPASVYANGELHSATVDEWYAGRGSVW